MKRLGLLAALAGVLLIGMIRVAGWALAGVRPGRVALSATVAASAHRRIQFHFNLPGNGFVTMVINNSHGRRVRNLIGAVPLRAGAHTEIWDGTNDQGQAVPAGRYQWQMLFDRGIGVQYQMTYGNPGTPPWATKNGTGGWGSDHTNPEAVVAAGQTMVLGWPMAENGWYLIGVNLQGKKLWGLRNRFAFGDLNIALASAGGYLYVASEQNPLSLMHYYKRMAHLVLYRYRLADQRMVPMSYHVDRLGRMTDAHMSVKVSNIMNGNLQGLAVIHHIAYVSLRKENRIAAVVLGADSRLDPRRNIAIPHPGPLAAEKNGDLLVVSGRQVLRVNPQTHHSVVLIGHGLDDPSGICVGERGTIYVACRGRQQQVIKFDAFGRRLGTIGVKGGRPPLGPTNPQGMYQPKGIAADSLGRLWVMEQDGQPKRTSVWNTTTGKLIRDFIGAPHYGALDGYVAPFDRHLAFGANVEYHLNWKAKTYRYVGTVGRKMGADDAFGAAFVRRICTHDGREYTATNGHVQVICRLIHGRLRPVAAVGSLDGFTKYHLGMVTGAVARCIPALKASGAKLEWGTHLPMASFIWTDQNGDGIPQRREIVWKKNLQWGGYWGDGISRRMTIYMIGAGKIYRLPVTGWTSDQAPEYSFKSMSTIACRGYALDVAPSPDGMLIINARGEMQGIDIANHRQVWTYPNPWAGVHGSHTANVPAPGRLIGPLSINGFAHVGGQVGTLFEMNGNLGQQFLMTTDGLWVAALFHDWRLAHGEGMYSFQDEDFGGYFWRDRASGKVYVEAGKEDYRLFRVTGLSTVRRSQGEFTLTPAEATAAATLVAARHAPRRHVRHVAVVRLATPMKISGRLADVPAAMHFTKVVANAANQFRFALGHDRKFLYLVYDVTDYRGFVNNGRVWSRMFKSGDCVDLMLGTNPKANPQRTAGVAGDERLLLTLFHKKPLAVLYKQVDPTQTWPAAFVSPSRAVYFGSVRQIPAVRMVVRRTRTGYVVMAKVPLATLGVNLATSHTFTGDVGVIYGSATGGSARLRLYWSNKDTAITSDVPSEAALQPDKWGQLRFNDVGVKAVNMERKVSADDR
jgi:hypothetical protein